MSEFSSQFTEHLTDSKNNICDSAEVALSDTGTGILRSVVDVPQILRRDRSGI